MANKPNNNDAICDELFNEEWHDKIQRVIEFTMMKLDESNVNYNRLEVAKKIIDFNINKTLTEALSCMEFPNALDFSLSNYYEAFEEFHRVLGLFLDRKEKRAELDIYLGNNEIVKDLILTLDSFISREVKDVCIQYKFLNQQLLHCTFLKVKNK